MYTILRFGLSLYRRRLRHSPTYSRSFRNILILNIRRVNWSSILRLHPSRICSQFLDQVTAFSLVTDIMWASPIGCEAGKVQTHIYLTGKGGGCEEVNNRWNLYTPILWPQSKQYIKRKPLNGELLNMTTPLEKLRPQSLSLFLVFLFSLCLALLWGSATLT